MEDLLYWTWSCSFSLPIGRFKKIDVLVVDCCWIFLFELIIVHATSFQVTIEFVQRVKIENNCAACYSGFFPNINRGFILIRAKP